MVAKEIGTETLEITTAIITTVTATETEIETEIETETEVGMSRAVGDAHAAANSRSLLHQAAIEMETKSQVVPQRSKTLQHSHHHST